MRRQIANLLAVLAVLSFCASPVLAAADRPLVMEAGQTKQLPAATTLQTSAGTTGAASVNLPHGAAPTAPVNGDLWTTTGGFYGRVNGLTVGPFGQATPPGGSSGQIQYNNAGAFGGANVSGDCTAAILVFTCSKLSGVLPGYFFDGTDASHLTGVVGATHGGAGTISGILKGNGSGTVSAATSGTDYAPATSGAALLYGNGSGGFSNASVGTGLAFAGGVLSNTGSGGSASWTANPFCSTAGGGNPCIRYGSGGPPTSDPNGSLYFDVTTGKIYTTTNSGSPSPARVQEVVNGATFAVTLGTTPVAGDTLIGFCHNNTAYPTPSAGWTKYGDNSSNFVETFITVVWHRVTSSDTTSQTPCSGSAGTKGGVAVIEASGVSVTFTDSVSFMQVGGATLTGSTTDANSLLVSMAAWFGSSGTATLVQSGAGWSNNAAEDGVGGANDTTINSKFVSSVSTSYTSTYNAPFGFPPGTIVLGLKPSTNATRQLSWLITMKNAGSTIDANPISMNFSTGMTATSDGGGNITVTSTGTGTVTTTGSPASGNLTKFSGSTTLTNGDLAGDCVTSGTLTCTIPAGTVTEAKMLLANNTTGDVSTSKHGFAPILPNDATKYLDGTGAYTVPAGGGGGGTTNNYYAGALTLISAQTLSGTAASVTFSSIPAGYQDLVVVANGRGDTAAEQANLLLQLNGDTAANYDSVFWQTNTGGGTGASGGSARSDIWAGYITAASGTASHSASTEVVIPNYGGTTFTKTALSHTWLDATTTAAHQYGGQGGGDWRSTAAVTSLLLKPATGNFIAGSTFSLYGRGGANVSAVPTTLPPQGRLTLTSGAPVMAADATAQSTIYYAPYQGNLITIGGVSYSFSQISYALNSTAHVSGNLYDVFGYNNAGTPALCTGPAWTNSTTRSAAISMTSGLWYNSATLTCNLTGGTTTTSLAAGAATYLGTFYATANGQTGMAFKPAAASGGANPILGLYNAYNRTTARSWSWDSTASWSYASNTWRTSNNSSSNRVSWVDGLAQSTVTMSVKAMVNPSTCGSTAGDVGVSLDSTTAAPEEVAQMNCGGSAYVETIVPPTLGFHYGQGMEVTAVGTTTFYSTETGPTRRHFYVGAELQN